MVLVQVVLGNEAAYARGENQLSAGSIAASRPMALLRPYHRVLNLNQHMLYGCGGRLLVGGHDTPLHLEMLADLVLAVSILNDDFIALQCLGKVMAMVDVHGGDNGILHLANNGLGKA